MAAKLSVSSLSLSTVPNSSFSIDQLAPATARFCAPPALKTLHNFISVRSSIGEDNLGGTHKEINPQTTKPAVDRRPLSKNDLSNSVRDGGRIRVAYQGVSGAYSEAAAAKAYPNCETVPCEQFDVAFEAVENCVVDRAVLPIENSLGGSIHRNYDLLLRHRLHIVGEVQFAVQHCLLANHGVRLEDLTRVLSHQQALAQCENTLTKLGVVREAAHDTAGAAQFVALHKLKDTGAVASIAAAKMYDLTILAQDIQDYSDNITRFLMLAREPVIPGTDRPFKVASLMSSSRLPCFTSVSCYPSQR